MTASNPGHSIRLMLTGGGTGGHLFPAVATAQRLLARSPESRVLFIGTRRKLDKKHLERYGFSVSTVHSLGLKGKKIVPLLKALALLPVTFCEACYHILKFHPDVVCGVGGYVTGPVVAAAWFMRKPTVIHEQNSVPGLANRKLGKIVDRICLSLPDNQSYFPAGKTTLTGNPVRTQILDAGLKPTSSDSPVTMLVLGGSQGARAINEMIVDIFTTGDDDLKEIKIIHQTGSADEDMVKNAYMKSNISADVSAFFDDMSAVYKRADFVVSRAGATTLAELAVLGKPAILIPYPYAADNHQEKNAQRYVDQGGARLLSQGRMRSEELGKEIRTMSSDQQTLHSMSEKMSKLAMPDAADRIVDICLEMAEK